MTVAPTRQTRGTAMGMLGATITPAEAAERLWDVVIVGAGPAGAMAAHTAAQRSAAVLLVDKAAFPRPKVCGCCINAAAMRTLASAGLGGLTDRCGARPLRSVRLAAAGRRVELNLPGGAALSREALDAALVSAAIDAGARFLPRAAAQLDTVDAAARSVRLRCAGEQLQIHGRVVVAADGLGGRSLDGARKLERRAARHSRIGAAAIIDHPPTDYEGGVIHMACARGGYVGLVRLEDGRLDVAAAFNPAFVRRAGSPAAAADHVLRRAGLPAIAGLTRAHWRGTPRLTCRRRRIAAERLLVVGDAAGYVEPFTGEGIGWALAGGAAAGALAAGAARSRRWPPHVERSWTLQYRRMFRRRQRSCRLLTALLRRPSIVGAALAALSIAPALARPLVRSIHAPPAVDSAGRRP